jgi:glutamate-1-semialdehyde aminotransferase
LAAASDLNIPAQIVVEGPVIDLVFTEKPVRNYGDFLASDRNRQSQLLASLKKHGILNISKFYVSIVHDQNDVDLTCPPKTEPG